MATNDELINATPRLILYVSSQVFDRRGTCWTIKKKETSQQTGQLLLLLRGRLDSWMQCRVLSNFYDDRQDIICSPRTRRQVLIFPLRITRDMHRVDIISIDGACMHTGATASTPRTFGATRVCVSVNRTYSVVPAGAVAVVRGRQHDMHACILLANDERAAQTSTSSVNRDGDCHCRPRQNMCLSASIFLLAHDQARMCALIMELKPADQ